MKWAEHGWPTKLCVSFSNKKQYKIKLQIRISKLSYVSVVCHSAIVQELVADIGLELIDSFSVVQTAWLSAVTPANP
jgi:hypothetical protein